jgi:uncharacterized protein involved in exopolysaccharide biosynthesis/Mrp family chromosome partitioning ATPase
MLMKTQHTARISEDVTNEPWLDIRDFFAAVRRQKRILLVALLTSFGAAFLFLLVATPLYTASTIVLVEHQSLRNHAVRVVEDVSAVNALGTDPALVDSQVELMKSTRVAGGVVDVLGLLSNPDYINRRLTLGRLLVFVRESIMQVLGLNVQNSESSPSDVDALKSIAISKLTGNLLISRIGRTNAIEIRYSSPDPRFAAQIANTYAQAYLAEQLLWNNEATRRASIWLEERVEELRRRTIQADIAVHGFRGNATGGNESLVELRDLEREAETYRSLYANFRQRLQQASQQQSSPEFGARVITEAVPPETPSFPNVALVITLFVGLGMFVGAGIGTLREFGTPTFRTATQIREELGVVCLAMLPKITDETKPLGRSYGDVTADGITASGLMRHVIDAPYSEYAEALRAAKVAADTELQSLRTKVLGVISISEGEGKSTVAKNFASLLAQHGRRVLLVDCSLRDRKLTNEIAPGCSAGLAEVLLAGRSPCDMYLYERETGLLVLPAGQTSVYHSADLLASSAMHALLHTPGEFDYIIADLPALGSAVDVRAAAALFSGFLLVVEWGVARRADVRSMLADAERVRDRCLGVVLNKVET